MSPREKLKIINEKEMRSLEKRKKKLKVTKKYYIV